jgi:predicted GH43/DUF377 family glycosyl hydrolase
LGQPDLKARPGKYCRGIKKLIGINDPMKHTTILFFVFALISCKQNSRLNDDETPDWAIAPFLKIDSVNPVLVPSGILSFNDPISKKSVQWEERNVLNPAAIVKDRLIYLLYRAQDNSGTGSGCSRIGLATSNDGIHFVKKPAPVLYPDDDWMKIYEWPGGCEDPRIVFSGTGWYLMTYTSWDGKTARLCEATSADLINWIKKGPVLANALNGKFKDTWSKSGSVISRLDGEQFTAVRIKGKYWMYWGDTNIFLAWSENLVDWTPLLNSKEELIPVLEPRTGFFDSDLVEPGPPALLREKGIVLIYNGRNRVSKGDKSIPDGTYSAGQALFDKNDPSKLIDRLKNNFLAPTNAYEKTGEVNNVCFLEGLVNFDEKLFLYYGTADSKIAVAVYKE